MVKLDIGGGIYPKEGFTNIDILDCADITLDLEKDKLPFGDESVDEVYSSHAFEHIKYNLVLSEILRVLKTGCRFELHVPHWNQSMAMTGGHIHTVSEENILHWTKYFVDTWFPGEYKFELESVYYVRGANYDEAKRIFPGLTNLQIKKFIPDTCHEIKFVLKKVKK